MPYDDPDPQDPNVLVGVELPGGIEEMTEMAWVLAEEFARLGFDEERIAALFRDPFHSGAHRAYLALGEVQVRAIARDVVRTWGALRLRTVDAAGPEPRSGPRRLPLVGPS